MNMLLCHSKYYVRSTNIRLNSLLLDHVVLVYLFEKLKQMYFCIQSLTQLQCNWSLRIYELCFYNVFISHSGTPVSKLLLVAVIVIADSGMKGGGPLSFTCSAIVA